MAKKQNFYDGYRWRVKTSPLVKQYNPQCQRIFNDGKQCQHHSEVVHHLEDPTLNPAKAYDWHNLVAVCDAHHSGGQAGERMGYRYAATCGPLCAIHYHTGGLLPTWHAQYAPPVNGDISRLAGTSTSTVGDDALDAGLRQADLNALLEGM